MKNKFFLMKLVLSLAGLVAITGLQQLELSKTYAEQEYAMFDSRNNLSDPLFDKAKAMMYQSFNEEVEENKENEEKGLVVYNKNNQSTGEEDQLVVYDEDDSLENNRSNDFDKNMSAKENELLREIESTSKTFESMYSYLLGYISDSKNVDNSNDKSKTAIVNRLNNSYKNLMNSLNSISQKRIEDNKKISESFLSKSMREGRKVQLMYDKLIKTVNNNESKVMDLFEDKKTRSVILNLEQIKDETPNVFSILKDMQKAKVISKDFINKMNLKETNLLTGDVSSLKMYKDVSNIKDPDEIENYYYEDFEKNEEFRNSRYEAIKEFGILDLLKEQFYKRVVEYLGNIAVKYLVAGVDDDYNLLDAKDVQDLIIEKAGSLKSKIEQVESVEELLEYFNFDEGSNGELILSLLIPPLPSDVPLRLFYDVDYDVDESPNEVAKVAYNCFSKLKFLFNRNQIQTLLEGLKNDLIKVFATVGDINKESFQDKLKERIVQAHKDFIFDFKRGILNSYKRDSKNPTKWIKGEPKSYISTMKTACPKEVRNFYNDVTRILKIKDNNDDIKESDFAEVQDKVTNRFNLCLVKKPQLFLTQLCDAIESVSDKLVKAGVYNKDNVDGLNDFKTEFNNSLIQTKLDGDYDFDEDERVLLDDFLCLVGFFSNADNYANLDIALSPVEDVEGDLANEAKKFKEAILKEYNDICKFFRDTVQPVLTKIVGNKKITSESIAKNEKTVNNFINNGEHLYYSKDLKDKVFRVLVNRKFNDIKKLNKCKDKFIDSIAITQDCLKQFDKID